MTTRLYSFLGLIVLVGLVASGCQRAKPKRSGAICIAHLEDWLNRNEEKVQLEDEEFGTTHNNIYLTRSGQITWNRIVISNETFKKYLADVENMNPSPAIHFSVHRLTNCDQVVAISTVLENSEVCKVGYGCSLEGRWHYIPTKHTDNDQ